LSILAWQRGWRSEINGIDNGYQATLVSMRTLGTPIRSVFRRPYFGFCMNTSIRSVVRDSLGAEVAAGGATIGGFERFTFVKLHPVDLKQVLALTYTGKMVRW
jgi:hypothetical protein